MRNAARSAQSNQAVGSLLVPAASRRRLGVLSLAAATCILGIVAALAVRANTPTDYFVYYLAGLRLAEGATPYNVPLAVWDALAHGSGVTHFTSPYRYPPFTAVLVRFLLPLGPGGSLLAWELASVAAVVGGAWVIGHALGGGWRTWVAAAAAVCFGPVYHTLLDGQVNAFVFLALAVAFWGLVRNRDLPLGLGIAVGTALKLTPLALIALLLWRRRWRAAGVAVAGIVVISAAVLPVAGTHAFKDYFRDAVALTAPQRVVVSPLNQSFTGVLGRFLVSGTTSAQTPRVRATRDAALAFALALAAASAAALWPAAWRRRHSRGRPASAAPSGLRAEPLQAVDNPDEHASAPGGKPNTSAQGRRVPARRLADAWAFSAIVAATLVVGPFTWYHQFMLLLIPLLLALEELVTRRRWRVIALFGALIVLVNIDGTLYVVAREWIRVTGVYRGLSFPFLLAMGLWLYSCVRTWRLQSGWGGRLQVARVTAAAGAGSSDLALPPTGEHHRRGDHEDHGDADRLPDRTPPR
jgi:hypothetical protein